MWGHALEVAAASGDRPVHLLQNGAEEWEGALHVVSRAHGLRSDVRFWGGESVRPPNAITCHTLCPRQGPKKTQPGQPKDTFQPTRSAGGKPYQSV